MRTYDNLRNSLNTEHISVEMWSGQGQGQSLLSDLLFFSTTHVDLCHKELKSHAELKLAKQQAESFISTQVQENRVPSCQHGINTGTALQGTNHTSHTSH